MLLLSASVIVMFCGVVCIRETDFAWWLYQMDHRLMGNSPPNLPNWRLRVKQAGSVLISLGIFGLMVGLT